MANSGMELGFAEVCEEKWRLLSHLFPSKLGGPPSWLSFDGVPGYDSLKCDHCSRTCKFLLQIYSPDDDSNNIDGRGDNSNNQAYHRTIFLFVCDNSGCTNRTLKCLRSQLSRCNDFYDSAPPDDDSFDEYAEYPRVEDKQTVCAVCHCSATKKCSGCTRVSYCSKEHQTMHWKHGHKQECKESCEGKESSIFSSSGDVHLIGLYPIMIVADFHF